MACGCLLQNHPSWGLPDVTDVPDIPDGVSEATRWSQLVALVMGNSEQVEFL